MERVRYDCDLCQKSYVFDSYCRHLLDIYQYILQAELSDGM